MKYIEMSKEFSRQIASMDWCSKMCSSPDIAQYLAILGPTIQRMVDLFKQLREEGFYIDMTRIVHEGFVFDVGESPCVKILDEAKAREYLAVEELRLAREELSQESFNRFVLIEAVQSALRKGGTL